MSISDAIDRLRQRLARWIRPPLKPVSYDSRPIGIDDCSCGLEQLTDPKAPWKILTDDGYIHTLPVCGHVIGHPEIAATNGTNVLYADFDNINERCRNAGFTPSTGRWQIWAREPMVSRTWILTSIP